METKPIICPKCATEIDLSVAMTSAIRADIAKEHNDTETKRWEGKFKSLEDKLKKQYGASEAHHQADIKLFQQQLDEQQRKVNEAQENELKLRAQSRKLEDRERELNLEVARKLDSEKAKISQDVRQQLDTEHALKLDEKTQQIESLRHALTDAKRKAEQGSQETQGEVLELSLEASLRQMFPQDDIESVSKGVRGADLMQTVRNSAMEACGTILWEVKNTKNWSAAWIQKLKDDQRAANAQISVLLSAVLPSEIKRFGQIEGVWVADIQAYGGAVSVLRQQLIEVEFVRAAHRGQQGKTELVYEYLIGDGFRSKVEAIVEAFDAMEQQLIRERRAMEKQWKEREQIIRRMTTNTVGMYGEIKGIVGSTLPEIQQLELDDGE